MGKHLLKIALKELENLNSKEKFIVKDLFKGYEWNRFTRGERLNLGVLFLAEVRESKEINIKELGKNSSNQQMYEKN